MRRPHVTALCVLIGWLLASPGAWAQTQDHTYTAQDIVTGSRLYAAQCAQCHGPNGDLIPGVNLRRGQFRRPMSDEDLRRTITVGVTAAGMPPFTLQAAELDGLVAFVRAGFDVSGPPVTIGNADRGRTVFEGKGACATCHRVNGKGPRVAPDLSEIGAARSPAQLYRSVTEPTKQMMPLNRPVRILMRDGRTIRGRRVNEDTYTVQLIDDQEKLLSLDKADIKEFELAKTSPMPPATALSAGELADTIAYLLSLKGLP